MLRKTCILAILLASTTSACKKKKEPTPAQGSAGSASTTAGSGSAPLADAAVAQTPDAASAGAAEIVVDGLSTPESALYDAENDRYLVSNINGSPAAADDNGFIVEVSPTGNVTRRVDGAAEDVKLDAPKGMAITGGVLYVADISVVRRFDAKTFKQLDDIKVKGASFLNDIVADGADGIFVSDTGVDASFKPAGTDAVYHVGKQGKVTPRIKAKDLGGPNGLLLGDGGTLWVVTFGSGELFSVDAKGAKGKPEKLPKGQLDGIERTADGDLLISSWEGKAVYRGKPGGEWKEVISGIDSPADIGWDVERKRVVIPHFTGNKLVIRTLE